MPAQYLLAGLGARDRRMLVARVGDAQLVEPRVDGSPRLAVTRAEPAEIVRASRVLCSSSSLIRARHQHGGAADAAFAQVGQRAVRVGQIVALGVHLDRHLRREREEVARVLARQVRDRADDALLPEQTIGKRRHVAHVDAGADDDAAGRDVRQRFGNEAADRREDDRRVERLGRRLVRSAGPGHAHASRERLRLVVAGRRERVHLAPVVQRDLRDDVRRRAEAVQPEPADLLRSGHAIRAVADQAGAQQRRRVDVAVPVGQLERVAGVDDGVSRRSRRRCDSR